jgi:diaminopimelate decarboxylase
MNIVPDSYLIDEEGQAHIGEVSLDFLAQTYQTPLYVLDEQTIRRNCRLYTEALAQHYPNSKVLYAGKANLNVGLINLMVHEGLGLDVVSGGELYTALKSQIDPSAIYFHGNNKSLEELRLALQHGVTIVVDNYQELQHLIELGKEGLHSKILIRLKPEIEAHTHEYIKTGHIDSKFGFDKTDLIRATSIINEQDHLTYLGLHAHIGSQIFDIKPFLDLVDILIEHVCHIQKEVGLNTEILNLGGGIGIQYMTTDDPPEIPSYIEQVTTKMKGVCALRGVAEPMLIFEPGRSLIGNAGLTIYTVGTIKEIQDIKTYVFVDGGMADNPRPMMYQAEYTYGLVNDLGKEKKIYAIAGKFCESGDVLTHQVELPELEVGDKLVVFGTGAYNYAMASNYNRAVRPAMVLLNKGAVKCHSL